MSGSGGRDEWRTEAVDSDLITLKEWENQKQYVVGGAENLLLGIINVYLWNPDVCICLKLHQVE